MATLITTIIFAAVITLPGRFEGGDNQRPGSAIDMEQWTWREPFTRASK